MLFFHITVHLNCFFCSCIFSFIHSTNISWILPGIQGSVLDILPDVMLESDYYLLPWVKCEINGIRDHKYALSIIASPLAPATQYVFDCYFGEEAHEWMIQCWTLWMQQWVRNGPYLALAGLTLYEAALLLKSRHSTSDFSEAPCVNVETVINV